MTSAAAQTQPTFLEPRPPAADAAAVLSFDVEEHHRIEAASGLDVGQAAKRHYLERVGPATRWLLDQLDQSGHKATFFIVGEFARDDPGLVQAIHRAGHEVASHGWDHRRIVTMTPEAFREDLRLSCDVLEQITGEAVAGYRAPTFSVLRRTAWALDLMAERGLLYDSSIYPVRHDRYGVPGAPRGPFLAQGGERTILELRVHPPTRLRPRPHRTPPGVTCVAPGGAFYAFMNISEHFGRTIGGHVIADSTSFCLTALASARVALVMGSAFGAEGYARLSFATDLTTLERGFDALEQFLK
jgi:polysaccharide deacetylase family protein (PEP-CTERM system associated)